MELQKNDIVTVDTKSSASNTFIVDAIEDNSTVLLTHHFANGVLIRARINELNLVTPNVKDSTERALDFAREHRTLLDYNSSNDVDALSMWFFAKRNLTPRQKQILANVCGIVAAIKFNHDLRRAMEFIVKYDALLDEFNLMWYNNFKGLFTQKQPVTSKKQRTAIFNIAGYVLAELRIPSSGSMI